ncbi:hypothetical protein COE15_25145 [Bacillus cereus]|nr:hypothetical protein CN288_07990 [Bacillus sp. AFS023182]PGX91573.1 hypothetical protein COE15_25145 [Bacillus cereus]
MPVACPLPLFGSCPLVFHCFLFGVRARRVGARPHGLKRNVITDKNESRTNDLGGSARILASPSREPLHCFLSFGLARKAHEPKKVLPGWSKAKKVEIFERCLLKNTTCSLRNF